MARDDAAPDKTARNAAILSLASQGLSSGRIVAALAEKGWTVSRSAVVGVCHRNCVPLRGIVVSRKAVYPARASRAKPAEMPRRVAPRSAPTRRFGPGISRDAPSAAPHADNEPLPSDRAQPAPGASTVRLRDTSPDQCRFPMWPDGDRVPPGAPVCGAPVAGEGMAYCPRHQALTHTPVGEVATWLRSTNWPVPA